MYFGSKNGDTTPIKHSHPYREILISPVDSVISKIIVNYSDAWIANFKFYNKENQCVLQTGYKDQANKKEILLLEGEKLLGVRSTHFDDFDS